MSNCNLGTYQDMVIAAHDAGGVDRYLEKVYDRGFQAGGDNMLQLMPLFADLYAAGRNDGWKEALPILAIASLIGLTSCGALAWTFRNRKTGRREPDLVKEEHVASPSHPTKEHPENNGDEGAA